MIFETMEEMQNYVVKQRKNGMAVKSISKSGNSFDVEIAESPDTSANILAFGRKSLNGLFLDLMLCDSIIKYYNIIIFLNSVNFYVICECANIDAELVRSKVIERLPNPSSLMPCWPAAVQSWIIGFLGLQESRRIVHKYHISPKNGRVPNSTVREVFKEIKTCMKSL